jgi:hypothetical protein
MPSSGWRAPVARGLSPGRGDSPAPAATPPPPTVDCTAAAWLRDSEWLDVRRPRPAVTTAACDGRRSLPDWRRTPRRVLPDAEVLTLCLARAIVESHPPALSGTRGYAPTSTANSRRCECQSSIAARLCCGGEGSHYFRAARGCAAVRKSAALAWPTDWHVQRTLEGRRAALSGQARCRSAWLRAGAGRCWVRLSGWALSRACAGCSGGWLVRSAGGIYRTWNTCVC